MDYIEGDARLITTCNLTLSLSQRRILTPSDMTNTCYVQHGGNLLRPNLIISIGIRGY